MSRPWLSTAEFVDGSTWPCLNMFHVSIISPCLQNVGASLDLTLTFTKFARYDDFNHTLLK